MLTSSHSHCFRVNSPEEEAISHQAMCFPGHPCWPLESLTLNTTVTHSLKHAFRLTSGISVEKEGVLELEIQVFRDGLCPILHAQPVHDGEAVFRRSRPKGCRGWGDTETHRSEQSTSSTGASGHAFNLSAPSPWAAPMCGTHTARRPCWCFGKVEPYLLNCVRMYIYTACFPTYAVSSFKAEMVTTDKKITDRHL